MIHAYNDVYLEKAQSNFAEMLDYAVWTQSMDLFSFFRSFLSTKVSTAIENGDYRYISGMSGIELCYEVLDQSGVKYQRREPVFCLDRTREYWCGWVLAYYQWYTNLSFEEIEKHVSIKTILEMYTP
ncbi:MAG: hypothetical protein KBS81_00510, partial [Spirochaetales bacterium]|nr:hypothetical protein [Candidatus Physcosoma equi]